MAIYKPAERGRAGLTLMEIIVSMIIISLTILGLANLVVAGRRHIAHSRSRMVSSELGKYFVDPLANQVRQDLWGSTCLSTGTGCPGGQNISGITYTPTYLIDDFNGMRRVRLTISWNETGF